MNKLKRVLGIVWLALALAAAYFCIFTFGVPKITSGKQDDLVFGIVILFVLTPIIVGGLFTFGRYALMGEYDKVE
jgi:nitric oxide reductase large subunit